jgi:hypothetical protein
MPDASSGDRVSKKADENAPSEDRGLQKVMKTAAASCTAVNTAASGGGTVEEEELA